MTTTQSPTREGLSYEELMDMFYLGEITGRELSMRMGWIKPRNALQKFFDHLKVAVLSHDCSRLCINSSEVGR